MLKQLKLQMTLIFNKRDFVYNCLISKVVDRPKLIQEYAEKYRTYKQSIFIDYSELK